ncbi:CocE/NonD family hydrolase [Robertkochia sediminum]|uniref:CocE/NonD family hydrolase n=1 Tax=Robertkochia sediminum TaxID=2785326 RepID=UPI0019336159|nr:CocE/NonD family hydrolase [Robertkochia sediminum]MBL7472911.1 CocE/NonD family hydrolase [Robertkochia sediminum]
MRKLMIAGAMAFSCIAFGQEIRFEKNDAPNPELQRAQVRQLAEQLSNQELEERDLYRAYMVSENYQKAHEVILQLEDTASKDEQLFLRFYKLYAQARMSGNFEASFRSAYENYLRASDDIHVIDLDLAMVIRDQTARYLENFEDSYQHTEEGKLSVEEAKALVNACFFSTVFSSAKTIVAEEIAKDHLRRYDIDDSIIIPAEDGEEISAVVVKRKGRREGELPTLLAFSIYAKEKPLWAMLSASKGYVGVVANTRGKRKSKSRIIPFEYENTDVYQVLDWISKQPWSDKQIGMYGGSYDAFTQWASMKHRVHPALKTIVPSVAIAPGIDYPMENNVLHNYSYSWNFYVTNNKYLDREVLADFDRWNNLKNTWYNSGVAFNKLDSLDGEVNTLWNAYMQHPGYDAFWKKMIPYKDEFSKIDLPVLTITGYYDDAQRGALYYYEEHHKYVKDPQHYLLIGPYDHWTAQGRPMEYLRNYKLDKAALIDIRYDVVYQWFDHILKGKEKPELLRDKVNFQVMGRNTWMHKPSLKDMTNDTLTYYLSNDEEEGFHELVTSANSAKLAMEVDLKDRSTMTNTEYYPWPLEREEINMKDGLVFRSAPLDKDVIINGSFLGNLELAVNKKDVDYSVILYQQTPEGNYFHLSYYIGRASYAGNREQRTLLTPDKLHRISFNNPKLVSKMIEKGSRIVIVVNVNKNNNAQINYGTGKDVNAESIKDADTPLKIRFTGNSSISLPVWIE